MRVDSANRKVRRYTFIRCLLVATVVPALAACLASSTTFAQGLRVRWRGTEQHEYEYEYGGLDRSTKYETTGHDGLHPTFRAQDGNVDAGTSTHTVDSPGLAPQSDVMSIEMFGKNRFDGSTNRLASHESSVNHPDGGPAEVPLNPSSNQAVSLLSSPAEPSTALKDLSTEPPTDVLFHGAIKEAPEILLFDGPNVDAASVRSMERHSLNRGDSLDEGRHELPNESVDAWQRPGGTVESLWGPQFSAGVAVPSGTPTPSMGPTRSIRSERLEDIDLAAVFNDPPRQRGEQTEPDSVESNRDPYFGASSQTIFTWTARDLAHRTLYFEDMPAERYGQSSHCLIQPITSGLRFYADFFTAPFQGLHEPPCELHYVLGLDRAGACSPPTYQRAVPRGHVKD